MARDLNVDQIKKLWILSLIVQYGSLKEAASRAKVSPSAISQTLSSLEQAFGKPLLIRERGAMTPTQDAIALLDVIRPAFAVFEKLQEINRGPAPKISWMNFGTYESLAIELLPKLMHSLNQKLPGLRLGLRISRTAQLLTMLRKGELCSALITEVDDLGRLYVKEVAEDRLGVYVSSRHPIAKLGWAAIENVGLGSLSPGKDGLPRYFTRFAKQLNLRQPMLLSDSFEALRTAAAAGSIVSVLPSRVAKRNDDLLEIFPVTQKSSLQDLGHHKILLVAPPNCDREESEFVGEEAKRILQART